MVDYNMQTINSLDTLYLLTISNTHHLRLLTDKKAHTFPKSDKEWLQRSYNKPQI